MKMKRRKNRQSKPGENGSIGEMKAWRRENSMKEISAMAAKWRHGGNGENSGKENGVKWRENAKKAAIFSEIISERQLNKRKSKMAKATWQQLKSWKQAKWRRENRRKSAEMKKQRNVAKKNEEASESCPASHENWSKWWRRDEQRKWLKNRKWWEEKKQYENEEKSGEYQLAKSEEMKAKANEMAKAKAWRKENMMWLMKIRMTQREKEEKAYERRPVMKYMKISNNENNVNENNGEIWKWKIKQYE